MVAFWLDSVIGSVKGLTLVRQQEYHARKRSSVGATLNTGLAAAQAGQIGSAQAVGGRGDESKQAISIAPVSTTARRSRSKI